jgi:ABC-type tungstate transport system substrate-binding protein
MSSPTINVLWGLFNIAVGYLLVCRVGNFNLRNTPQVLVLGAGILFMSVVLARTFGQMNGLS